MNFQLIVYPNKNDSGTKYQLESNYIIGRDMFCEIHISDRIVSSEHCTLIWIPQSKSEPTEYYLIKDGIFGGKESSNGTFLNGQRITKVTKLYHQDEITFGARYPKAIFLAEEAENDEEKETFLPSE